MEPVTARFAQRCGICDDQINEGDQIVQVDDEWVHERCADDYAERAWQNAQEARLA